MADHLPLWQRELLNFKGIKSLIVLHKNVQDIYPLHYGEAEDDVDFVDLNELLTGLFGSFENTVPYRMVYYDPVERFVNLGQDPELEKLLGAANDEAARMRLEQEKVNSFDRSQDSSQNDGSAFGRDTLVIRALLTRSVTAAEEERRPVVVVVNTASRLVPSPSNLTQDEVVAFANLQTAAHDAVRVDGMNKNTLVLVANNLQDLPEWLVAANPDVRSIVVPRPDRKARTAFVAASFGLEQGTKGLDGKTASERLIDKTDGMSLRELDEIRRMYARRPDVAGDPSVLVDVYKYGLKESQWASVEQKLKNDPANIIRRRVKGQDRAVEKVVSVLKRSALGLSGATHSSSGKPKGILFLSGPTGTGKTEIVKAVTELLFGDERSLLRFDMSEYKADNADQKLFGAPPGYVGYSEGGQLTNAVMANPFSVILFDEIEKASDSIMDKFLQILEDGRMTDGQGRTVYFSETLIFFTSNIGFSQEIIDVTGKVVDHVNLVQPGTEFDEVERLVGNAMRGKFKPEFLGRIGDNIVTFDYIDDASTEAIVKSCVERVNRNVKSQTGVTVEVDDRCWAHLVSLALATNVKEKGGRGIGNVIESSYLNVLSDYLFDNKVAEGASVLATAADDALRFEIAGRSGNAY